MFIERAAPNLELESFFSQIAIHGYKPRLNELQARMVKVDGATRILHDPTRRFYIKLSRKKRYDPVEFLITCNLLEWNDGTGVGEMSEPLLMYLAAVEERAVQASRGKMFTIRDYNRGHSNVMRDAIGAVASGSG